MNFNNKNNIKKYFIIGLNNVKSLEIDLQMISTGVVKTISSDNNLGLIATFETDLNPDVIKESLNIGGGRSFFISQLNPNTFSGYIDEYKIHKMFFDEFDELQKNNIHENINDEYDECDMDEDFMLEDFMDEDFMDESNMILDINHFKDNYNEKLLLSLSTKEKEELIDELLDEYGKLNNNQKKVLNFLAS